MLNIPVERMEEIKLEQLFVLALIRAKHGLNGAQELFLAEAVSWLRENTDGQRMPTDRFMTLIPI